MVDVIPFTPDYQAMDKVLIVYAEVQYTCQYIAELYIIMFSISLSVPSMGNTIIPPFIMRESGLVVKDTEKFTYIEDHSIYFPNFDIHITLFLHGVLSYFFTSNASLVTLEGTYEIQLMIPDGIWNPVSDA